MAVGGGCFLAVRVDTLLTSMSGGSFLCGGGPPLKSFSDVDGSMAAYGLGERLCHLAYGFFHKISPDSLLNDQ